MNLLEFFFLALGVSLDSLIVSVCKGASSKKPFPVAVSCGVCFGLCQFVMPVIGYFLGKAFHSIIDSFDHFIVFGVLLIFGINMIREAFKKETSTNDSRFFSIFLLAFFSSFDSLGVGLTLSMYEFNIFVSSLVISALTFILGFVGVFLGKYFEERHKKIICILGGLILITLGTKILITHLLV